MMNSFAGLQITVSEHAVAKTLNWSEKKRSRRLHKKMTKRLGPQWTYTPTSYRMGNVIVCHPTIYSRLKASAQ